MEGDNVKFECLANGNPDKLTYQWYVDGRRIHDVTGHRLFLEDIDRRLHEAWVRCEVTNSIGRTEASTQLNVYCKF